MFSCLGAKKSDRSRPLTEKNKTQVIVSKSQHPLTTKSFIFESKEQQPLANPLQYKKCKQPLHYQQEISDKRQQTYAIQESMTNKSQLLSEVKMMNYQLDVLGGVSGVPTINTFIYQTSLTHYYDREEEHKGEQN